ncbi:hypothetical protein ABMA27_000925 [Loxostege sticticalis]|uniref:Carboxylic ester hydrolase n=2 Tax=Loxostege sticticalis TaxID=481309 RepID=A0ABR3I0V5_LOXSC
MTSNETCIIQTTDGDVCGYIDKNEKGTCYYKFKKIPYAKPPLGQLRFQPPSPVARWEGVIDCTQDAPLPYNYEFNDVKMCGSEDCLYIELSTPNIKPDKPLPVMFWIGTYKFVYTIDNHLDPSLLNDNEVVFVRCGFRLGPFGFLSINEFSAPGNCGLKDIVMALKWVQKNIERFGGDPNNVTIFGSSSGGSAVHLLMLSPMATGLFHKAIIQSASAFNHWALTRNPSQHVMELCEIMGIAASHENEIIEKLRSACADDIMAAFIALERKLYMLDRRELYESCFKPCIEIDFEGLPAFLTKSPMAILKSGNYNKVPLIIGSNNIEAAALEHLQFIDFYEDLEKYNDNVGQLVPRSLSLVQDTNMTKIIGNKLLTFYRGDEDLLTKTQYVHLISDYYFLYFVNKTVRLHKEFAPECPVYYYIVNCPSDFTVPKELAYLNGFGHSTELMFLFKINSPDIKKNNGSPESIITRQRVIKMWTNFAKYGNPTPDENDPLLQIEWDPVENQDKLNYLSIDTELTKGRNPFQKRMEFWEELHKDNVLLRMMVYFSDKGLSW